MRTLGNVLWLLLAGWWPAVLHVLAGIVAGVLITTIPFGRRVEVHRGADRAAIPGYRRMGATA